MTQFLETICIRDGSALHLDWHQRRVNATLSHFYPQANPAEQSIHLQDILAACAIPPTGIYKCRIVYSLHALSVEFFEYAQRSVQTLSLVSLPEGFDYRYKYADRTVLDDLFEKRGSADDVLLLRNGWITDTSNANIAFRKENRWYTPSWPLLAGTTWKRLIHERILIPRPVHVNDLNSFDGWKIFNAMRPWEEAKEQPLSHIN